MPWLIDGDNLLGTGARERTDAGRRRLARELERFAQREGKQVVVVFDGRCPDGPAVGGDVRWAGSGRTADDVILDVVRKSVDPRGWIVVTEDKSLGDRCRWLGARLEKCAPFRKRIVDPGDGEKPPRESHVDDWIKIFGE